MWNEMYERLLDKVIAKYGFEAKQTLVFATLVDNSNLADATEYYKAIMK